MDAEVRYPIYLVPKGSADLERLADSIQLESWVVKTDVQDRRYLAWDYYGRPLNLRWDNIRLECALAVRNPDGSFEGFFKRISDDYDLAFGELVDEIDFELAYNRLKSHHQDAIKKYKAKSLSFKRLSHAK